MFDELINEEKINLHDQLIYTDAISREKKYLMEQIAARVK